MDQVGEDGKVTTLIHYVFQSDPERIACMPNMTEFHQTQYHPNYQRSNSPQAVTCGACRRSKVYADATGASTGGLMKSHGEAGGGES